MLTESILTLILIYYILTLTVDKPHNNAVYTYVLNVFLSENG
jgi:hypothetical protein